MTRGVDSVFPEMEEEDAEEAAASAEEEEEEEKEDVLLVHTRRGQRLDAGGCGGAERLWRPSEREEEEVVEVLLATEDPEEVALLLSSIRGGSGLPRCYEQLNANAGVLSDRLLRACHSSPSAQSRRPLLWCAGLLRLLGDEIEARARTYNHAMPPIWDALLHGPPTRRPLLIRRASRRLSSLAAFFRHAHSFHTLMHIELSSLEDFLARRRRRPLLFLLLPLLFLLFAFLRFSRH